MHQSTLSFGRDNAKAKTAVKRKPTDQPHNEDRSKFFKPTITNKIPVPQPQSNVPKVMKPITPESSPEPPASNKTKNLQIIEELDDIFDAPPNTLIIHACNCEGSWFAGIAKAFHDAYPSAFYTYADYCDNHDSNDLMGKSLLIPPKGWVSDESDKHFIGCLFTSRGFGRKKDSPAKILEATGPAMEHLLRRVRRWNAAQDDAADAEGKVDGVGKIGEIRMCQINSGLFKVPWKKTKAVLEGIEVREGDDFGVVKVFSRE